MTSSDLRKRQCQWSDLVATPYLLDKPDFHKRGEDACRWFMQRARQNVEMIVERLKKSGYRFLYRDNPYRPASEQLRKRVSEFESTGFRLPLSLRIWFEEVGSINLVGSHPNWPCLAYLFECRMPEAGKVWLTEPLVVEPWLEESYEQWQANRNDPDRGSEPIGPFCVDIAPDDLHKANISGGDPLCMCIDTPQVDGIVLNERNCVSFLAYLRIAFRWGGFPGFECYPDAPMDFIEDLKRDLLPL